MKQRKIKTILSISIAVLLLFGLTACGKTIGTGGGKPEGGVVEATESVSTDSSANKETADSKEAKNETTTASNSSARQQSNTDNNSSWDDGDWDDNYNGGGTSGADQPVPPPAEAPTDPPAPTWTISVSVDAGDFGGVFGGGTYTFYYQPTAYDALVATGITHNARTSIYGVYVSSINGLAEFDYGGESGWHYAVNNAEPGVGCSEYYLNDGDYVLWHYKDSIY